MGSFIPPQDLIIPVTQFTPTITCGTPGDLNVVYNAGHAGYYSRRGNDVKVIITLSFTPTYTTATGNFQVNGLPFPADSSSALSCIPFQSGTNFPWPNTGTQLFLTPISGQTYAQIQGTKSGSAATNGPITGFISGNAFVLRFRGSYTTV